MTNNTERFLIPSTGMRVVDPATGNALPALGAIVRGNEIHWLRRLADGDVTEGMAPAAPAKQRARKANEEPRTAKASQE